MRWLKSLPLWPTRRRDCFGRAISHNFNMVFRRDYLAECLWEYGEDGHAEAAMRLSDEELHEIQRLAVWHHENDPEPESGPRLLNARIAARAAIEFFEREARDTKRRRRRTRLEAERYDAEPRAPDTPAEQLHYPGWDR
jgi:hypothetical protein